MNRLESLQFVIEAIQNNINPETGNVTIGPQVAAFIVTELNDLFQKEAGDQISQNSDDVIINVPDEVFKKGISQ